MQNCICKINHTVVTNFSSLCISLHKEVRELFGYYSRMDHIHIQTWNQEFLEEIWRDFNYYSYIWAIKSYFWLIMLSRTFHFCCVINNYSLFSICLYLIEASDRKTEENCGGGQGGRRPAVTCRPWDLGPSSSVLSHPVISSLSSYFP